MTDQLDRTEWLLATALSVAALVVVYLGFLAITDSAHPTPRIGRRAASGCRSPGFGEAREAMNAGHSDQGVFVGMEALGCYGSCPSFILTLSDVGVVRFEGNSYVARCSASGLLRPDEVLSLAKSIRSMGFFALNPEYSNEANGCRDVFTDASWTIIRVRLDGIEHHVRYYYGCNAPEAKSVVVAVENAIVSAAGAQRWIR